MWVCVSACGWKLQATTGHCNRHTGIYYYHHDGGYCYHHGDGSY